MDDLIIIQPKMENDKNSRNPFKQAREMIKDNKARKAIKRMKNLLNEKEKDEKIYYNLKVSKGELT